MLQEFIPRNLVEHVFVSNKVKLFGKCTVVVRNTKITNKIKICFEKLKP